MFTSLALGMPGLTEWIIIGALGLLFFGKRLPDVGRSLGKGIVEFKKGLKGIEDDIDTASSQPTPPPQYKPADQNAAAEK
jgi:sec-independent protein translocase protein TatA